MNKAMGSASAPRVVPGPYAVAFGRDLLDHAGAHWVHALRRPN
ncbi:hypothetical protein ACFTXM_05265 [Streptomyces sp. NPDC056930]